MLTPEQNGNLLADAQAHGTDRAFDEAYRLGVAAERKRCAEVCKSFVMGRVDSYDSHDEAWWSCINEIERGEDA